MATNDFLTFAGGSGANVLSQADYAALTSILSNGFSSGVAQSAQVNKVLRQASIMSAVLAQLIVDTTGQNAADDGTVATLLANLKAAVNARSVGVVGTSRNASMNIATAGVSGTFTADELIVVTALGGLRYCLANVSDTFNLTTDMDTGSAPASGFVALYKLFNPTTGASLRRIVNCTATIAPEVYAGAAAPAGFTASALVAVLPTNAAAQFVPCSLSGRTVSMSAVSVLSTTGSSPAYSPLSLSAAVPKNAKSVKVVCSVSGNAAAGSYMACIIAGSNTGFSAVSASIYGTGASVSGTSGGGWVDLVTAQTAYLQIPTPASGTQTSAASVTDYTF